MAPEAKEPLDDYIRRLKSPHREIVEALRRLLRTTGPELKETVNPWGNPTWIGKDNVFWIMAYRNHVDFGFFRGTDLRNPKGLLEGTGKRLRHVKIREVSQVRSTDLKGLIREALALDRAT